MFDYQDNVVLEEYKGKDETLDTIYESPKVVKMKLAFEGYKEEIKDGNTVNVWQRIYHSPFKVDEKSKVDGRKIDGVTHCRIPIIGVIQYRIVVK